MDFFEVPCLMNTIHSITLLLTLLSGFGPTMPWHSSKGLTKNDTYYEPLSRNYTLQRMGTGGAFTVALNCGRMVFGNRSSILS